MKTQFAFPVLSVATVLILTGTASPALACQPGADAPGRGQYRMPAKRMPLSTFLASVKPRVVAEAAPLAAEASIVGLWHTARVVGDQVEEAGFEQFGMGGVHVLNDPAPILEGNVCLGAWTQTAPLTYLVNHPAYVFDAKGEQVIGIAHIYSKIVVDAGGDSFKEDYKVIVQDLEGATTFAVFEGKIVGKRIKGEDNPLK